MIILDTNIISELMKPSPHSKVSIWVGKQDTTELYITALTIAEIEYGICILPDGNRRALLKNSFEKVISAAFKYRVLAFDKEAAELYGKLMGERKLLGRPLSVLDGQIAAIALTHNFSLATRNIKDFSDSQLHLINPFE